MLAILFMNVMAPLIDHYRRAGPHPEAAELPEEVQLCERMTASHRLRRHRLRDLQPAAVRRPRRCFESRQEYNVELDRKINVLKAFGGRGDEREGQDDR